MVSQSLPDLSYQEFFLWLIRRRRRFRVTGNSMLPLLHPGEEVLINPFAYRDREAPAYAVRAPAIGDIVVATHPYKPKLIVKRIAAINPDCSIFLIGDNLSASTDSRSFGTVSLKDVSGKVTARFGFKNLKSQSAKTNL